MDLLNLLIVVSQKAANIARVCRKEEHLFDLLVQKKKSEEANPRFVQDFKTLADVLIQEMVKYDLTVKFPELTGSVQGEENNIFKNKLGETIHVNVKDSQEETSLLLEKVLNGDKHAANLLALEVHQDIKIESIKTVLPLENFDLDLSNLGVWIDPIDCTAEYIHGNVGSTKHNIDVNGLKCVTVLIGVYNKNTKQPVIGVINRPFIEDEDCQECVWGVSLPCYSACSIDKHIEKTDVICISSSESEDIKSKLKEGGFELVEASGAGYKILTVVLGMADAYILTKGTTFKWDTCGPHSVLKSLGGDIVEFKKMLDNQKIPITYSCDQIICNSDGIIAYKKEEILNVLSELLQK